MNISDSQMSSQESAVREREEPENARGHSVYNVELHSVDVEAHATYLLGRNESSHTNPVFFEAELPLMSSPANPPTDLNVDDSDTRSPVKTLLVAQSHQGDGVTKQYTFFKENDMKLSCLDVLESRTVFEYTPGAHGFAHKILDFGIDRATEKVILVVHLADVYGSQHVEVLRICTTDWIPTTLLKKELPIENEGIEAHQLDSMRVYANAKSALILLREDVILVDWLAERVARLLIPISVSIKSMKTTYMRNLYFVTFDDEGDYVTPVPSMSKVWIPLESLWAEVERHTYPEPRSHNQGTLAKAVDKDRKAHVDQGSCPRSIAQRVVLFEVDCDIPARKLKPLSSTRLHAHGGDYRGLVRVSRKSYHHIESLSDLAPLHSGCALVVIEECLETLPDADSITFFNSIFHSILPDCVARYAIDPYVACPKGLRKYGFHGLSYSRVSLRDCSADTSKGLTSLDGLPSSTHAGYVDPSLVFHYTSHVSVISRKVVEIANGHQTSALSARTGSPDHPCETLAFNLVGDRILGHVGEYFLKLGERRGFQRRHRPALLVESVYDSQ
ncbi:hypothetical protein DFH11DRAFT_1548136 [Phellopilus nigrolimitatus]|nr:hypothetical protein DFH11DRAFT_1548136 [Phellopilus nigrolimitatus]